MYPWVDIRGHSRLTAPTDVGTGPLGIAESDDRTHTALPFSASTTTVDIDDRVKCEAALMIYVVYMAPIISTYTSVNVPEQA